MRYGWTILALVIVLGGVAAIKACQIGSLVKFGEASEAAGPPPEYVGTAKATLRPLERTIDTVGSVASERGLTVSNEVPGVVDEISFQSGQTVERGQVLVRLDTEVERADLEQARSNLALAKSEFDRSKTLFRQGVEPAAMLDTARSNFQSAQAEVASLQAQLARKVIRAPFTGRVGRRNVSVGQYLAPGTAITELETLASLWVDFTLPQQRLEDLEDGMPVRVRRRGEDDAMVVGTLEAIDLALDPETRSIQLRAEIDPSSQQLRPGMFVDVEIPLPGADTVVMVPATAVVHEAYGDSVFVIEDKPEGEPGIRVTKDGKPVRVARQQFVRVGPGQGDFVSIAKGVRAGEEVVIAGAFKLDHGAPVVVDNDKLPRARLQPQLPNR